MDERVMRDVIGPIFQLLGRRQFAMKEQVSGFQIRAFLREILDGIAAVTQNAGVAINKSDSADARSRVVERRVVTHHPEFFGIDFDLAEVGGPDGAVGDRDFVGFSGAIVSDGECFAGRGSAIRLSRLRCGEWGDRMSTRLNSSYRCISYAVF